MARLRKPQLIQEPRIKFFSALNGCFSVHPTTTGYFQLFYDCPLLRKSFTAPFTVSLFYVVKYVNIICWQAHCASRNSDVRQPCCGHPFNRWSVHTQISHSLVPPRFIAIFIKRPPMNSILNQEIPLHTLTHFFSFIHFSTSFSFWSLGFLNKCLYTVLPHSSPPDRAHGLAPTPMEQRPWHNDTC